MLFLRPYTLKRATVQSQRPKEADPEAGMTEKSEGIATDAGASQLPIAPAAGDGGEEDKDEEEEEAVTVESRQSISKTRPSSDGTGTIAGEPEIAKQ